jgi:hypothetical protein
MVEFIVRVPGWPLGWSVADQLTLDGFGHLKYADAGDLVVPMLLEPHDFFLYAGQVAIALPGAEDMEGFDVEIPAAARLVIGTGGGDLVTLGIGKEADFLVIDVMGVDRLLGVEGLAVLAQGDGDANVEAISLN